MNPADRTDAILIRALRVKLLEIEARRAHYKRVIEWLWARIWSRT